VSASLPDSLGRILLEVRNADRARREDGFHGWQILGPIDGANYSSINGAIGRVILAFGSDDPRSRKLL
jgi:hypothetical protein